VTGTRFVSFPRTPFSFRKEGGLNLLNVDYVIESQLSEKGREVRLMRTLVESDTPKGLGVDENAALIVKSPLTRPVAKVQILGFPSLSLK
jgi:cyanophycinase